MKQGRMLLVITLVVAILATGVVQSVTLEKRRSLLRSNSGNTGQSLASMDSFALALLLGGLRGPLVMFLWTQSESQKVAKNLEGVETQIEWIRLLQPEFDSVHLFQIWNKAYNLSVQMASLPNKYSTILDAIDYARSVEAERPDDLNMIFQIGSVFSDKLSGSQEKDYYRKRVRQDSKYRVVQKTNRVAGVRPTQYESVLDPAGNIRPELLQPRFPRPTTTGTGIDAFYDGSELQFLKRYEPFPYGVSPSGLAYNYLKRAQVLQRTTSQRHLQIAPMVVDSRAGLALKNWGEEEWELGTRTEAAFWGEKVPAERFDVLLASADKKLAGVPAEQLKARSAELDQTLFQYELSLKVLADAATEVRDHLANPDYAMHMDTYRSQLEQIVATQSLVNGDLLYLKAARLQGAERVRSLQQATKAYEQAAREFLIIRLRYFVQPEHYAQLFPAGVDRFSVNTLDDAQLMRVSAEVDARIKQQGYDMNEDDTREYHAYVTRAMTRMALAKAAQAGQP